jgi:hypothetical protein
MINNIGSSSSEWLNVVGSSTGAAIYIDNSKVQQGIAGQVRHTGNNFEVNDGYTWKPLYDSYATVDVTHQAREVFQWVTRKMAWEKEAEQLAQNSRAVAAALKEYKTILAIAEERLNMVIQLSKEHA